jgi:anti-sigma28 factor (negative regulator of flagellin synthesis)
MPEFCPNNRFENGNQHTDPSVEVLTSDKDLMMEQILDNINTTPIGQVLRKIASLPEVRREKILDVRRQITEGKYDLDERLDVALDKVLEYLTA